VLHIVFQKRSVAMKSVSFTRPWQPVGGVSVTLPAAASE
jgi:hypothetical protein